MSFGEIALLTIMSLLTLFGVYMAMEIWPERRPTTEPEPEPVWWVYHGVEGPCWNDGKGGTSCMGPVDKAACEARTKTGTAAWGVADVNALWTSDDNCGFSNQGTGPSRPWVKREGHSVWVRSVQRPPDLAGVQAVKVPAPAEAGVPTS